MIKIDFFDAGEFDLWRTAAFYFQQTLADSTANAFFGTITVITFDVFGKNGAQTAADQQ